MRIFRHLFLFLVVSALFGCTSKFDDGRNGSSSLGTTYQILESRGGYDYFLAALEKSDYKRLVDGGGLVTVFAPGDEAFKSYLQSKYGTFDLDQIATEDLTLIMGYHIIQFAYNKNDFLSFSTISSQETEVKDEGSCYKYQTYAREAIKKYTDPITGRVVTLFSREKYVPVFSSRIFSNRGIADAESDYKRFFPDVNWVGSVDQLYAGNATITESGIPSDNGYLYIVDKMLKPLPTIYDALATTGDENYTLYKKLFERFNLYQYSDPLSKKYAQPGDSLYLFYHYRAPKLAADLPEIASEWTYHDENGVVFERGLRYANNCFAPDNATLEAFLKSYFKEFGTESNPDYLKLIPDNAIYHLLSAHSFGARDIILPSELDKAPIIGSNGENFRLSSSEVKDVVFCTNGVVYGMEKMFIPAIYNSLSAPAFKYPYFTFFSLALNTRNMYQLMVDPNNRFTLFMQSDEDLNALSYRYSTSSGGFGDYTLTNPKGNMSVGQIFNFVMSQFVYGELPDPSLSSDIRYYVTKDNNNYFYLQDGSLYDYAGVQLTVKKSYETDNGTVYQTNKPITQREGGIAESFKGDGVEFRKLLASAGLVINNVINTDWYSESIAIFPTNAAVISAVSAGKIPPTSSPIKDEEKELLRKYLMYYFMPVQKNKLSTYLLPGIGPEGVTDESYDLDLTTFVPYVQDKDKKNLHFKWDKTDPTKVTVTSIAGHSITSKNLPRIHTNALVYTVEDCFDYRTIFDN